MAENSDQQHGVNQGSANQGGSGSGRGLASADQETKERVASMGGKVAHEQGTAHEWEATKQEKQEEKVERV